MNISYVPRAQREAHAARIRAAGQRLTARPHSFIAQAKADKAAKARSQYGLWIMAHVVALALGAVSAAAVYAWFP